MRRFLILLFLPLVGCGGKGSSSNPVSPTPVTPVSLNAPAGPFFIGGDYAFTSNVQGTWGSDATTVATVNGAGQVHGVSSGDATIFVDAQGQRATKRIHVMPNYAGTWAGSYTVAACQESGQIASGHFCRDELVIGRKVTIGAIISQTNNVVTATMKLGSLNVLTTNPTSGTISDNGELHLDAVYTSPDLTATNSSHWDLHSTQDGQMTGRVTVTVNSTHFTGFVQATGDPVVATRTSAIATGASAVQPLSLDDMVLVMTARK